MTDKLTGIHHITAIAGAAQTNFDFYTRTLGLRVIKRTINFDDPNTHHFYFGDRLGNPGSLITFFPWAGARKGKRGTGQVAQVAYAIPEHSLDYWIQRLRTAGLQVDGPADRFGEGVISFMDPDGLLLELVCTHSLQGEAWDGADVPAEHAIRGFHSASLFIANPKPTVALLERFGFVPENGKASRTRYRAPGKGPGGLVDVVSMPSAPAGVGGAGTVHHIAWRAATPEVQLAWRDDLIAAGLNVTPVLDRQYFRSIYFREPGGVLFEIATDGPGMLVDETPETLGSALRLPPWLEGQRSEIESALPVVRS